MDLKTIHPQFGLPILSNGKLPVGIRTKNKILTKIQYKFLHWFGEMPENSRLASIVAKTSRKYIGSYIYSLKLEINNTCQLQCEMCYIPKAHSELPLSQIDSVFKQIKNCGIRIELLGGESLLRPDLDVIVKKAKHEAHSPFVSVYSNGMLATPDVCNSLKDAGLDAAIVTLISTNKQVHDAFTGCRDSWEKTVEGIRNFRNAGIETFTFTAVHSKNRNDTERIHSFVTEELKAKPLFYQYIPIKRNDPLCITKNEWYAIKNRILSQNEKHARFVRDFYMLTGNSCSGGNFVLTIKVDGSVQPCPFISNLEIGNIADSNIWDIYKNRYNSTALKDFKKIPEECKLCTFASVCGGGCRAGNDRLFDSYYSKDFRCMGPYSVGFSKMGVLQNTPCFF